MENYDIIIFKLNRFVRKYYFNQLIKGLLFLSTFLISLLLLLLFIESIYYLSSYTKKVILISYLLIIFVGMINYVLIPIFGILNIRRNIKDYKINELISNHFPDIKDTFWNLLELKKDQNHFDSYSFELVQASINQKVASLKNLNFQEVINLKTNFSFISIFLIVSIVSVFTSIFFKDKFSSSSNRLINFSIDFEKPSPYKFFILNENLEIGRGDDFILEVEIRTDLELQFCNIIYGGNSYRMVKDSINTFKYKFSSINNSINFNFEIDNYNSKLFSIDVLERPLITSFSIEIEKPLYTNQPNQLLDNLTNIIVPNGSYCIFTFNSFETDSILIHNSIGEVHKLKKLDNGKFIYTNRILKDDLLLISISNKHFNINELFSISIKVIVDEYPKIAVQQIEDSLKLTTNYFKGIISDDYGFSKLNFIVKYDNIIDTISNISITNSLLEQSFYFAHDFLSYKEKSNLINFYFEVFDNDYINGYKSSISENFIFNFPDINDLFDTQDEKYNELDKLLIESNLLTKKIKEDIFELQQKVINSEFSDWEKREAVKNIINNKNKLENTLNTLNNINKELNSYNESFTNENQIIAEKQKLIQDLLENVFSDELKKLMEEFNKMIENFDPTKLSDFKEKMDFSLKDMENQIDKNLEMLRKMQIEQKLDLIRNELNELIEKQEKAITRLDKENSLENIKEEQSVFKEDIKNLKEEFQKTKDLNEKLENRVNLLNFDNEFNIIDNEFDNTINQLEKSKKNSSSESMKKNSKNMKDLGFMIQQMMESSFKEQNMENISNLLNILNNLVVLSFNQEEAINLPSNDFFTKDLSSKHKKIQDHFMIIQDSLYSLAKREPMISSIVNKEIVSVLNNFALIDNELREGRNNSIKLSQQMSLTSINNLALFMSELISNLQQQLANSSPGNQNCKKPGNKPNSDSMGSLKSMQKSIQQQLEKLMQMMKDGNNSRNINNELGQALSQQELMQNMLREMMNEGTVGSNAYETLKQAEQLLDKVRQDIIKNNISNETINKQKQILTRLLEAENSENEREQEERRKSNTSKEQFFSNPSEYFEKFNSINNFEESLIKNKLLLRSFYQYKYQNYITKFDSLYGKSEN
jgi:hypothetical protein